MDPLSITTGCLSLLGSIGQTSLAITSFVRSCEARGDLAEVVRELSELKMVLELLQGDQDVENDRIIPESLKRQILGILVKCNEVLVKIDAVLEKHRGRVGDIRWVATGKNDVANLCQSLEAYRGALSLVLETITLALTRQVKADTNAIRADAFDIKQEIAKIREDIERLRSFSNQAEQLEIDAGSKLPNPMLQRYLESLTTYAETVCEDIEYQNDQEIDRKERETQDATTLSAGFRDLDLWQPEPSPPARYSPQRNNTRGSTSQMAPQLESNPTFTAASTSLDIEEKKPPGSLLSGQQPQ
ncbi:hypothetical protein L207DRAFT_575816 [Hyaloscypha variabilis F]|uniref:Azaphilone pigments biosynthesis cluster protein L N-terminal domain-containing protein n=1 Tax=Hyaloscypha variabilis (strain UAMH 11265 / GT02V1 / F) TaxID=1149755 RepID=A0A2J6S8B8_HYAVF|nr:hypothetical protein L207DRAFT_575816 [Hyaloscypha variabilis F]